MGNAKQTVESASGIGGAGALAEYESFLRKLYSKADEAVTAEAKLMLEKGGKPAEVAKWAHETREAQRLAIRKWDLTVARKWAEARNMMQYGRAEGPTLKQLQQGWTTGKGIEKAGKSSTEIIESAGRANANVNKVMGRLRIAGRICIAFQIGYAIYEVAEAPQVDRPKVLLRETGAIAGGIGGAAAGAELCFWGGPWVAGGCAIVGGIGGAYVGHKAGNWVAEQLYPPSQTRMEIVGN